MRRAIAVLFAMTIAGCGSRTDLVTPDASYDAGFDAGHVDAGCDAGIDRVTVVTGTPLGESCTDMGTAGFTIRMPACPIVEITPAFADVSDGSGGQPAAFAISSDSRCFTVTWDDCAEACDCDLDIVHEVCVSVETECLTLIVTVTNRITEYEAGNHVEAGYVITRDGISLLMSGTSTRRYVYPCG